MVHRPFAALGREPDPGSSHDGVRLETGAPPPWRLPRSALTSDLAHTRFVRHGKVVSLFNVPAITRGSVAAQGIHPRAAWSADEFSPLAEVVVGIAAGARIPALDRSTWLNLYPRPGRRRASPNQHRHVPGCGCSPQPRELGRVPRLGGHRALDVVEYQHHPVAIVVAPQQPGRQNGLAGRPSPRSRAGTAPVSAEFRPLEIAFTNTRAPLPNTNRDAKPGENPPACVAPACRRRRSRARPPGAAARADCAGATAAALRSLPSPCCLRPERIVIT